MAPLRMSGLGGGLIGQPLLANLALLGCGELGRVLALDQLDRPACLLDRFARDYAEVNLGAIQKLVDAGKLDIKGTLDHDALKAAGLARGGRDGVRLLGKGELKAKLAFKVAGVSKGAREAVEKAGGSIELIERKNPAELAAAKKGKVREKRLADQAAAKAEA